MLAQVRVNAPLPPGSAPKARVWREDRKPSPLEASRGGSSVTHMTMEPPSAELDGQLLQASCPNAPALKCPDGCTGQQRPPHGSPGPYSPCGPHVPPVPGPEARSSGQ